MSNAVLPIRHERAKWLFFIMMAVSFALVLFTDERFLLDAQNPEWVHIAPFKWWLLVHGLAGLTALLAGPFQFSDMIRHTKPALHRWTGWTYVSAVFIAAPIAVYMGTRFHPSIFAMEVPAQAGLWFLTTSVALVCILRRNVVAHRAWMMKSYCFALIFVISRVPDAIPINWTDAGFATLQWYLTVVALVGPETVLTFRQLSRQKRKADVIGNAVL